MSFNAVVILTDEEVRQPTGAGREIYPVQRVDTDINAHLRRDDDYVSVPAKYKRRLIGYRDFETTKELRRFNVDSHNIVCS